MENVNFTLNDEGDIIYDEDKEKSQAKWKKIAIIAIALCLSLIILIVIIILIYPSSSSSGENKNDNPKIQLGEIKCIYDVGYINEPTPIISSEYDDKNRNFDISVNNEIIPFSKNYTFASTGYQIIKFILYGELRMEKMFKEIDSLISVEMYTSKNIQILSIASAFESCSNFNFFNMSGFDTSQIKSISKLFYNTEIDSLEGFNFDTKNVQDFSFFFAIQRSMK
jgi:hypothetical protein